MSCFVEIAPPLGTSAKLASHVCVVPVCVWQRTFSRTNRENLFQKTVVVTMMLVLCFFSMPERNSDSLSKVHRDDTVCNARPPTLRVL